MSWTRVTTTTQVSATSGNLTLTDGGSSGDLLVACISYRDTPDFALPSGWTLAVQEISGNNSNTNGDRIASGLMAYIVRGGSAPDLTFTRTAGGSARGQIEVWTPSGTPELDVTAGATMGSAGTAVSVGGFTTTANDELLIMASCMCARIGGAAASGQEAATDPTSGNWTERADGSVSGGAALAIATAEKATAGATGTFSYTASTIEVHVILVAAFKIGAVAGDLSKTLGAATISAAGGVAISGALSGTLAALAVSADGTHPVTGDFSKSLGAVVSSAAGGVATGGALTGTLGAVTIASAGTADPFLNLNVTLGALSLSSGGAAATAGAGSITLSAVTSSAAGGVAIVGALAASLGGLTITADGLRELRGALTVTLGSLGISSGGTHPVTGDLSGTLGGVTVASAGSILTGGALSKTLGALTSASDGSVGNAGVLTKTLGSLAPTAAGVVATGGVVNKTLAGLGISGVGVVANGGALNATMAALSIAADAAHPVVGAAAITLGGMAANLSGAVDQQGAMSVTLGGLGMVATGSGFPVIGGDLIQTLGGLLVSAAGTVATGGILTTTLAPVTISAAGAIAIEGNVRGVNLVPNSMMVGAQAGGALPTGWGSAPAAGLTVTYVGVGVESGKTYFEISITGTPSAGSGRILFPVGGFGSGVVASVSDQFNWATDFKVTPTTGSVTVGLQIDERNSGGTAIGQQNSSNIATDGSIQHLGLPLTMVQPAVARFTPSVVISHTVAVPLSIVMRIYQPQVVEGLTEKTFQPTYGGTNPLGDLAISAAGGPVVAGTLSKTLDPMTVVSAGAAPVVGNLRGQNLLLSTQDLGQPAWVQSRSTVLENVALASDGTFTADKIVETANPGTHRIYQSTSKAGQALVYTVAAEFKAAERGFAQIRVAETGETNAGSVAINLSTGAVSAPYGVFTSMSAASDPLADGWFRLRFSFTTLTDTVLTVFLMPALDLTAATPSYTGDGTSGIYASKVQLQRGVWTAYQYNGAVLGGLLAPLGVTSAGGVATGGALSKALGALTLSGAGAVLAAGSLTQALAPLSASIQAGNLVTGDLSRPLGPVTGVSGGAVATGGVVNNTLGAMVLASTGQLAIAGVVAGKNLITQSERPDLSPWANTYAVITPNAALAPNGTTTAAHIAPNNGTGWGSGGRTYTITKPARAMKMTWAFSAKADEYNLVLIWMNGGNTSTARCYAYVNVSTGAVVSGPVAGTSGFADVVLAVTAEANGFWRISLTATTDAATVLTGRIYAYNSSGSGLGDGVSGVLAWGFMANYGDPIAYEYQGATNSALMGPLTMSGAGGVAVVGDLTRTLGPLAIVAAGAVANIGALTKTLGPAAITAAGAVVAGGALSVALGSLVVATAGQVDTHGALTRTMAPVTATAAGGVAIAANLNRTFGALVLAGAGGVAVVGALTKTMNPVVITAAGAVPVVGNLARLLGPLALQAQVGVTVTGSLTRTFGPMSGAATGKVWPFRRFFFSLN